ncbi:MAG: hypothetical protein OHK0013_07970 [Sandaracinaceae bacterium]
MAEPTTQEDQGAALGATSANAKSGASLSPEPTGGLATKGASASPKRDPASEVPIVFRVLIGAAGLAMLVGFFFPWVRRELEAEGETVLLSGLSLLQQDSLAGTPSIAVIVVPVLGTALAAIAFTGFRYTAYVAIAVSVLLFGYAAYVLFQLFVQHTGLGLWITTASAFLSLLFGAGTLFWMRRAVEKAKAAKAEAKAGAAAKP